MDGQPPDAGPQEDPEALVRKMWAQITGQPDEAPAEFAGGAGPIGRHPTQAAEIEKRLTAQGRAKFDAIKRYEAGKTASAQRFLDERVSEPEVNAAAQVPLGIAMRNAPLGLTFGYGRALGLGMSESDERELNAYRQRVIAHATAQRIQEKNPDWTPTQVLEAARQEMRGGLPSAQGGLRGFIAERALPMGVDLVPLASPEGTFGRMTSGARALLGAGEAASTAGKVARSAAAGAAAFGVHGALRATTVGEEDAAQQSGEDPGSLWSRVKRGAQSAVAGATSEGLGAALLPKELGANARLSERLANWTKGIPGRAVQAAAMGVASSPKAAVEDPAAVLADSIAFALMPGFGLEGNDAKQADKVREAMGRNAPRRAAEEVSAQAAGLGDSPEWAKTSVERATAAAPEQPNVAAVAATNAAQQAEEAKAAMPDAAVPPPSVTAQQIAKEAAPTEDAPAAQAAAEQLKLDSALDAQPQHARDVSRETIDPGALDVQAADIAKAAADHEAAAALPQMPPRVATDPKERWTPPSVDALREALKRYDRGQAVYRGTEGNGDDPRRQALQRTLEQQRGEIDRMLLAHEGRTLQDVEAMPPDSPMFKFSPGLAAVAGTRPLPSKAGGITNDVAQATRVPDTFAVETMYDQGRQAARKAANRIASELKLSGNQEVVDKIAEHGEDVAYLAGQTFSQQTPMAKRDEAWQRNLRAHVKKEVDLAVNSYASMYAKHLATTGAAQKTVGATDPATLEDKALPGPDGNPERFLQEKAVLAMAGAPGGPLDGMTPEAQSEVAQAWLHEVAVGKRKAAGQPTRGRDIPGRSLYDIAAARYVALHGQPEWLHLSKSERQAEARAVTDELTEKVASLHEWAKQRAKANGIGVDVRPRAGEAGTLDTDVVVKGGQVAANLWNTAGERRAFYSRSDIENERQWGMSQMALRAILDTGEKGMTTRVMENALDLAQGARRRIDDERARQYDSESRDRAARMSDDAKYVASDYLSGGRLSNKGQDLPDDMRDAAYADALAKLPPDQQAMVRDEVKRSRADYDAIAKDINAVRPGVKLMEANYFPQVNDPLKEVAAAEKSGSVQANLLNSVPEFAKQARDADEAAARDIDVNYARLKSEGRPFSENLLHRKPGDRDYTLVDHDPVRARQRYMSKMRAWVEHTKFADYIDREIGGDYAPVRLKEGDKPRDALVRFTGDNISARDAIKVDGRSYQLATADTGDDYNFALRGIGGVGSLDVKATPQSDGSIVWRVRNQQWDPERKEFAPRGSWRDGDVQIRQGGIAQIPSYSTRSKESVERELTGQLGRKPTAAEIEEVRVGGGRAHEARVQALRDVLSRVVSSQALSTLEKNAGRMLKLTATTTLAANPAIAAHIAVAGTTAGIHELGPKYLAIGMKDAPTAEGRAWAKNVGMNLDPITAARMLDPNAKFGERSKALFGTALDKTFWPMQQAHRLTRSIIAAGARARAYDEFDAYAKDPAQAEPWQRQAMAERMKGWALRGITTPDEQREAYARQQALAAAERTGTLISAVTTPKFLASPAGRVLSQFMRPAIQTFNTGLKMLGREPASGNFTHLARFLAVGALAAWLDRKLRTNVSWTLGPRVADLGDDWFGSSPGSAFPKLNDPDSPLHHLGDLRLPFQTPLGVGPLVGTARDLSRSVFAWIKGDDDQLGRQWWLHHDLSEKLARQMIPGFKVAQQMSDAFAPGSALSTVRPSGDPDAPWASYSDDGRLEYRTTREELLRRAFLGSVGSNQTANALQFQGWEGADESNARANKSAEKRRYIELVRQYRATKDPEAAKEGLLLEQKFGFDSADVDRAEKMDNIPAWGRQLSTRDQNGKFDVIYKRYREMERLRTSPAELLDVVNAMLPKIDELTPDRRDQGIKMYRDLEARAGR